MGLVAVLLTTIPTGTAGLIVTWKLALLPTVVTVVEERYFFPSPYPLGLQTGLE